MRRDRRDTRGAAALEFAIVLPILLLLIVGTIEWGRYFVVREAVVHAAREGARAGTLLDAVEADACAAAAAFLVNIGVTASCPGNVDINMADSVAVGGGGTLEAVSVRVHIPFTALTGLTALQLPTAVEATAVMAIPPPAPVAAP